MFYWGYGRLNWISLCGWVIKDWCIIKDEVNFIWWVLINNYKWFNSWEVMGVIVYVEINREVFMV